ncbi:unnamed protein product, partial [Rotaria sp. Silwood2]
MVRLKSHVSVRRKLQLENTEDVPIVLTIKRIYNKILETGSVEDRDQSGRPVSATTDKITEISEVLTATPITSVRQISQE